MRPSVQSVQSVLYVQKLGAPLELLFPDGPELADFCLSGCLSKAQPVVGYSPPFQGL
jgi:hypothetical protein